MSRGFSQKVIADLEADIAEMKAMQEVISRLQIRNSEGSTGSCLLDGIEVLLRETITHYEEDRDRCREYLAPEGAA